jgi:hypothetical protein
VVAVGRSGGAERVHGTYGLPAAVRTIHLAPAPIRRGITRDERCSAG